MMKIYQPTDGVGRALKENSFAVIDDVGVQIGQGGLIPRLIPKGSTKCQLEIEMEMGAHPMALDTLFGALRAGAKRIQAEQKGTPARLFVRCAIDDVERREYFMQMGFDDYDGDELFLYRVPEELKRRRSYAPMGAQSIEADLRTRVRREKFLMDLVKFGCVEHACEWLEERMKEPSFIARSMYYGSSYIGSILVTGMQKEAVLEMVCVEPSWRGKGAASALVDEVVAELHKRGVPYLVARSPRRNQSAMRLFQRAGFEWIRTENYLLGQDI